jgi:DNA-binding NarL/FixJ family response regulator
MPLLDWLRTRWGLGILGGAGFSALLALEFMGRARITPWGVLLETSELALTIGTAVAAALLASRMQAQHEERVSLLRDLEAARTEGDAWRQQVKAHLDGLGTAIEKQLRAWRLTDAEGEVSQLMLKGFSHKEIGALRGTSEATVRQQARAVYEKSGLNGRAGFCAYFLEDLLPPAAHMGADAREIAR